MTHYDIPLQEALALADCNYDDAVTEQNFPAMPDEYGQRELIFERLVLDHYSQYPAPDIVLGGVFAVSPERSDLRDPRSPGPLWTPLFPL